MTPPVTERGRPPQAPSSIRRREVYPRALVDGQELPDGLLGRARRRLERLLVSRGEREEAELERLIRSQPAVTRPNTVAVISPKGGVGKTTSAFAIGNLLADRLRLRVVAVDANPDFGTLAALAPSTARASRTLADLLDDSEQLATAAQLRPYVTPLPTGLHLLAAPTDPLVANRLGPDAYGELLALLHVFYEVVLLDLGTGVAGPLAQLAIERSDQLVLVTTPEWVTASVVLDALEHLEHERTTVALNKCSGRAPGDLRALEQRLRDRRLHRTVAIPFDGQLATMLDSGTYQLDALERATRMALKRLAIAVAEQLV
ncbi:MAG: MinD/ParA family protein [Actinobacteria bacterium]|nr:MinD/ParA family protein [Actinomycetota bacterium]